MVDEALVEDHNIIYPVLKLKKAAVWSVVFLPKQEGMNDGISET